MLICILALGVFGVMGACAASSISIEGLLTEYSENPLGVDTVRPGFSWRMVSSQRGARQAAYQVQVATSLALLRSNKPDMWDSGKIESSQCTAVAYSGKSLRAKTRYYWRVCIWDANGTASRPGSAIFETGLLSPDDWQGKWITIPSRGGNGYHTQFADSIDMQKWVQVDLKQPRHFKSVALYPARPYNWQRDEPGFGFPVRYRIEISDDPSFSTPRVIADRTTEDQPNPKTDPVIVPVGDQTARCVRLVAIKLAHPEGTRPLMALTEMELLDESGTNVAAGAQVSALDSIENNGWGTARLTDSGRISSNPNWGSPMLRHEFTLDKPIASARAYVTGLGYYELRLNGKKVGDRVLDPPRTTYTTRVYYSTYDVTKLLRKGRNAVGAMLGEGWWRNTPDFLLQLNVTFADGTSADIVTDNTWRSAQSPIVENSLYGGETYDAAKEQAGWDMPGFDDSKWQVVTPTDMPGTKLCAEMIQPIKIVETLVPKSVSEPKPGIFVFDFGQNFSGWCNIKAKGSAGTKVTLKHAEVLFPDGTVNQQNLRSAKATDTYILRGAGVETYEPRFTYHGFRYVQVEGYPGKPSIDSIRGRVVHTALEPRGEFSCSNEMLNAIQRNSQWGERTNFHSIPTDCPQRDERQGWMGDAAMTCSSMLLNFNMPPANVKFLQDIADAQSDKGGVPDTVPHIWGGENGDPMWSIAYPIILWNTYLHTGDKRLLDEHYDGMKSYVELLRSEAKDGILARNTYGDWVAVVETPKDLISTGAYYQTLRILADMARELNIPDEAERYNDIATDVAKAFNGKFLDSQTGIYGNGSQFSYAMPIALGFVPQQFTKSAVSSLVRDIHVKHKDHLSTGFIGTPYLMDALVECGRADVAYKIAAQETYPGWGYMVKKGATTIWELWQYADGGGMNSHNHPAFSLISGWFYRNLAGINVDPKRPGWEHFIVKPYVMGDLKWAKASVLTLRGTVAVDWKLTDKGIRMDTVVPANSSATVFIPTLDSKSFEIREGNAVIWRGGAFVPGCSGITNGAAAGEWISFEVGAGSYEFELM